MMEILLFLYIPVVATAVSAVVVIQVWFNVTHMSKFELHFILGGKRKKKRIKYEGTFNPSFQCHSLFVLGYFMKSRQKKYRRHTWCNQNKEMHRASQYFWKVTKIWVYQRIMFMFLKSEIAHRKMWIFKIPIIGRHQFISNYSHFVRNMWLAPIFMIQHFLRILQKLDQIYSKWPEMSFEDCKPPGFY